MADQRQSAAAADMMAAIAAVGCGNELSEYLLEAQEIVEPVLASLAAARASGDEIQRMRRLVAELASVDGDRPDLLAEVDMAFHDALAEASHNPVLAALHAATARPGAPARRAAIRVPGVAERVLFWHRHIVAAIEARDREAVGDAMRLHVRQSRADIEQAQDRGLLVHAPNETAAPFGEPTA